jgi:hypothetical protein
MAINAETSIVASMREKLDYQDATRPETTSAVDQVSTLCQSSFMFSLRTPDNG